MTQQADIKPQSRLSKIWLVPLLALTIGGWMLYYQWSHQGRLIEIEFAAGAGLEAEKSKIKVRDLDVGVVKRLELKEDLSGVIAYIRMQPGTDTFLGEETRFWLVTPKVSLSGVSGLGTLLSGPYIHMEPAKNGDGRNHFVALSEPPVTEVGTPGLHITLTSNHTFTFKTGDPVLFKGLTVGEFESESFDFEQRTASYRVFIRAPYSQLVTENTRFWNSSGVRVNMGVNGIQLHADSIESLMHSGVTFGVPTGMPKGKVITRNHSYEIFDSYKQASDQRYKAEAKFAIFIESSVRGLEAGAPVEYRGLEIGRVLAVSPQVEDQRPADEKLLDTSYAIPVIISIQPGRIDGSDNDEGVKQVMRQTMHWVEHGLKASLKTGSLLTGAQYVDLQHYPQDTPYKPTTFMGHPVIPTVSGEFAQLTEKANQVLDTINNIPFDDIATNANQALGNLTATLTSFQQTAERFAALADSVEEQGTVQHVNALLVQARQLLHDYSAGSNTNQQVNDTLLNLRQTLNELQPLLKQLNNAPNSLIFSGEDAPDRQPGERQQ